MNRVYFILLLFWVIIGLINGPACQAQLQNWEFGIMHHRFATDQTFINFNKQLSVLGASGRGHASLVDLLMDGQNHRLRIGDYFGTAFGMGYAKESKVLSSGEVRELQSIWLNIDIQAGLQAAFAANEDVQFGFRAFKEFQFNWVVMGEDILSRFLNLAGGFIRYKPLYVGYDHGWNWAADRSAYDGWDRTSRFNIRWLLGRKSNYLGIRLDLARRYWELPSQRVDRQPSIMLNFGRVF